ncbi:LPS export ABC transporter permease LptG [Oecophyllibacter saccharovorans]|uniref:LPS export ABC transporter permease LptG n=1 Tax=Oecophyllibacter saccharovorans TaxID=2558360 RepID=UPI001175AF60|nr:LPS export ABC transporter permease LptG [Oecophyllibacter saccharovorans]TPW35354.1 LPS export ABC transporter permease LptG [Oecophyllibacter saccharovorans]
MGNVEASHAHFSTTLARYFGRRFLLVALAVTLALTALITLFDFIDLLRRASAHPAASSALVLQIAALHMPYYLIFVLPFAMLLGGMICFARLARSSELIVARASGQSAWQFLSAPVGCAVMLGVLATAALTPLSSRMYSHAEMLDEIWLRDGTGPMLLSHGTLWLRQDMDGPYSAGRQAIIHVRDMHLQPDGKLHVTGVTVLQIDSRNQLLARLEAPNGQLDGKTWIFNHTLSFSAAHPPHELGTVTLPSAFTVARIRSSASPPDTLSVWALPGFIRLLGSSGFPTLPHRLRLQALLALPILAGTMTLVSAGFSMRPARRGGVMRLLGAGVAAGFALFTVSKVAEQLGKSGALPPVLAAWAPAGAGLCLAAALLLHMEDG